jgi:membrane protease YdiL (CAAX protease family)
MEHPKGVVMTAVTDLQTAASVTRARSADAPIAVNQYSRRAILAIWAAAALPMGILAWIVAPALADGSGAPLARSLIVCLTAGLIWQCVLAVGLVSYEQRTLRWSRLRAALWLQPPRSPRTGRVGGRTWLVIIPLIVGLGLEELIPSFPHAVSRDLGEFVSSDVGKAMFNGSWGWFAVVLTMLIFNTVLGEELLFRGVLLPRMQGAFRDRDWIVNGVLFATYHLHMPWGIPAFLLVDTLCIAYPARRYQSAWIGIAAHSVQSVLFAVLLLTLVL